MWLYAPAVIILKKPWKRKQRPPDSMAFLYSHQYVDAAVFCHLTALVTRYQPARSTQTAGRIAQPESHAVSPSYAIFPLAYTDATL